VVSSATSKNTALDPGGQPESDLPRLHYSCYIETRQEHEAAQELEKELQRNPRDFTIHYYLACLDENQETWAARVRLTRLNEAERRTPSLLRKILMKQGRTVRLNH
jgi:hypothetical protein